MIAIGLLASRLTFLALIIFYLHIGHSPNAETLFYILTIFQQLAASLSVSVPTNLSIAAQIQASLKRISKVLHAKEDFGYKMHRKETFSGDPYIRVQIATVKFKEEVILKNIFLELKHPGLIIVTGAVGAGKSSLLKLFLKDYQPSQGI